ncbi:MAG: ATP-binding protein [Candidatus Omnitrophica bacterium]|nr:ATP-binding protein [Candidatus Omnitrophota bacterium]
MRFINRETELNFLNEKWQQNSAQLIIIYGKRRVGKTEISIQFVKDKPHIYFLCERLAAHNQLKKFTEAVGEYFKDEFLPQEGFKDWETAFKYIANKREKLAVIIDEFPYLAETDKAIPSTFQKAWDIHLKTSKVYLILLGSSISMMEKTALFYKAPLYGRRTGQFLIKPFRFKEVKKVFPDKTFDEILAIYSIAGGTPLYLNKFCAKNYLDVIKEEILRKGQPLYDEVEFLLREELKEPRNYFVILEALSLGKHKLSEIINETGFDKGTSSRYISILASLQITKKEIPVTEKMPEKSRKGIYIIEDNFFNFWFRLVFRNRSLLEENKIVEVAAKIKAAMPELLAKNYEKISGEILLNAILSEKLPLEFETYGRWWDRNEEIDLVALNSKTNEILFSEVKWSNKPIGTNIYEDLKKKSQRVEWGKKNRKEYFALFSKAGFTPEMKKAAKKENIYLFHMDKLIYPARNYL